MKVLLDTNIVLRLLNQTDPEHQLVVSALERLVSRDWYPTICSQNLYEFWVVGTRPERQNGFGLEPAFAFNAVTNLRSRFDWLPDPPDLLDRWLELVTRYSVCGRPAHDARLVALMLAHGVGHILTLNTSDFSRYTEITCLAPADV